MRSLSLLAVAHTSLSASKFTSSGQSPSITATSTETRSSSQQNANVVEMIARLR
ncbi:hypothetical protein GY45DRAFT_1075239 [Cubamyces sp. BRFM 1775]|nr:hypothetical protein GY45DRAFT_1075239 [Cubamyces sp. BRFM 1775]